MKYLIKMNSIKGLKCCFFGNFTGEIKNDEVISDRTGKKIKIKNDEAPEKSKFLFITGKIVSALILTLWGLWNMYHLTDVTDLFIIVTIWTISVYIMYLMYSKEEFIPFITLIVTSIYVYYISDNSIIKAIDLMAQNVLFFMASIIAYKAIEEYFYDEVIFFRSQDDKFIFKAKEIQND